jgi:hypothetical protein
MENQLEYHPYNDKHPLTGNRDRSEINRSIPPILHKECDQPTRLYACLMSPNEGASKFSRISKDQLPAEKETAGYNHGIILYILPYTTDYMLIYIAPYIYKIKIIYSIVYVIV